MPFYVKQYLISLGIVLLAMLLYRGTVVPMIEPTRREKPQPIFYDNEMQTARWWQRHFPADAWQQDEPKIVQTARGILLFKTFTQLAPDQWRLEPLTMIIPHSHKKEDVQADSDQALLDQDVLVVNADQGATIQFREAFDLMKGKTPPVIGGRLEGQIHITRKSKLASDERPWHLTTSDVQIDRRKISTIKPVEIRWDNSVIRGRDLSIFLKQDLLSDSEGDPSPWGILENMELIYIDEINVGLPPGGLWADMKQASPELPVTRGLPAQLRVQSGGPFRFDFVASQASLMNGVHATHQVGSLPPDLFESQEVQVTLAPTQPNSSPKPPQTSVSMGAMQFKQLIARGMDPVGPIQGQNIVRFDAPNIGASARAKRLNINFVDNQLELAGRLEGPQAVSTLTTLDYLGYSFRSPSIQYRQSPDANHLGWLFAEGPGELLVAASSAMGQCNVRWQQSLNMKPDGDKQWISLIGKTLVESKVHGFMTSESLDLWLKPELPASPPKTSKGETTATRYLPDRLRAIGDVTLATPQIKADVKELQLWLVHAPAVAPGPASDGLPLSDSAGNPMYQFIGPPAGPSGDASAGQANGLPAGSSIVGTPNGTDIPAAAPATALAAKPPRPAIDGSGPVNVQGTLLKSTVIVAKEQSWIDTLTVDGPLKVFGNPTVAAPNPWSLVGQQLQLSTNPQGQANVQVTGSPAKIAMGEAWLIGPVIRYDQTTGLIWMDQPGEFSIPTTALNRNAAGGANPTSNPALQASPSSLQWIKAPHCKWKGRLIFDGTVANIEGDIELEGIFSPGEDRFWSVECGCQQMEIYLGAPINMHSPKRGTSNLDRVVLKDSVDIRAAQNDSQGNRLSLERIVVPSLTYHLPQSQLVGSGPGWLRSWHLASTNLGQMASSSSVRKSAKQEIQGAHLNFHESMVAYMDRSEVVFEGKVELAAGPLASWDHMIDINTMQRLNTNEMLLNCDLLKAYDTSGLGPRVSGTSGFAPSTANWEFQSLGNVRFAGKSDEGEYSGSGYRVTYSQPKDLLVLEGDGRTPAHVRKEPLPNSREQPVDLDVISAAINVKTMKMQDVRITRIGIEAANPSPTNNPLGNGPLPKPASNPKADSPANDPRSPAWLRPKQ
ncbi:MAG: hypothetical protein SFV81_25810 [Pirellulaceae bacterium]|nr:hypothetical protein [Pirellulaceae bacterium]